MERNFFYVRFLVLILTIVLAGCGNTPAAMPAATATPLTPTVSAAPDPCTAGQIEATVEQVNRHMREFDDAALLASNLSGGQLSKAIVNLQKIRREADDEQVPDCLTKLKAYQIEHMNSVINTMLAFVNGTDQQTVDEGIKIARQQHDQYTLELARLLGLNVVRATVVAVSTPTGASTP